MCFFFFQTDTNVLSVVEEEVLITDASSSLEDAVEKKVWG